MAPLEGYILICQFGHRLLDANSSKNYCISTLGYTESTVQVD